MSAPTTAHCPLGLTPDDLSAWRDHTLPSDEERRITAHLATCLACQRILAADETLAATLAADQPPPPNPRNWQRVQARIAGNQRPALNPHRVPRRALWSGLAAAAAVLLISALFFNLFDRLAPPRNGAHLDATPMASPTPVVTPQPIPTDVPPTTPIAGTPLQWQTREGPADLVPMTTAGDTVHSNTIAFSATDARTAYVCSITRGTADTLDVWASHDGALSWTHVNTSTFDPTWDGCKFNVDAGNPMRVELTLTTRYGAQTPTSRSLLSDDGGKTWRTIADKLMLYDIVTQGKTSFAMKEPWPPVIPAAGVALTVTPDNIPRLVVSHDDWQSWSLVDSVWFTQGLAAVDVWQRPGDGALLASVFPSGSQMSVDENSQLWQSLDLGAHWTRIPTPTNMRADGGYIVAQPLPNAPWRACGAMEIGKEVGKPTTLVACTQDSGQTWETRPMPLFSQICVYACSVGEQLGSPSLTSNGTLLGPFNGHVTTSGVQQQSDGYGDYLALSPQSTQWQDMGNIGGVPNAIGGPTTTLVILPNAPDWQVPTGRRGSPSGSFITQGEPGVANTIEVATLP